MERKKLNTVKEIVDHVLKNMTGADKLKMRNTKEDDLIMYHHGFGTQIRNTYGLWEGNPYLEKETGKNHPDDISFEIIKAIWRENKHIKEIKESKNGPDTDNEGTEG